MPQTYPTRLKISSFKSIKNCDISLDKTNVLIGGNGTGKSNLILALTLLQDVLNDNLQVAVAQRGIDSLLYNGRKQTDKIRMEVFFDDVSYDLTLATTGDNRLEIQKEIFKTPSVQVVAHTMWDNGKNRQPVTSVLAQQNIRAYHFHDTGRDARVKQEHNISNSKVLLPDARNLAAFLYRLKNFYRDSYDEIVRTIQIVAPFFDDFVLEPQEHNKEQIILKWKQKGCDDVLYASQLSDGTLRFICLATLLLQPHELQPSTIMIEEPELGLNPRTLTILAEMIQELPKDKQIILTTQSADLLDEFRPEEVIVAERGENGSTFGHLDVEELQDWFNSDYSLGDLWKKNILNTSLKK